MDRQKNKALVRFLGSETVRKGVSLFGHEKFSFHAALHEHLLTEAEQDIKDNVKFRDIKKHTGYSPSSLKRLKRKYIGIKNTPKSHEGDFPGAQEPLQRAGGVGRKI